jgi:hypothetical protein
VQQQIGSSDADARLVRTILVLLSLWGGVSLTALRRWRREHAVARRDDALRALLAGRIPLPRAAAEEAPAPVRRAG